MTDSLYDEAHIAVVAMSGRFPQSQGVDGFWASCKDGDDCVSRWETGSAAGGRVLAGGLVADQDLFDAKAFGVSPAEAELLDPQHRIFLEVCWEALEQAAVVPDGHNLVSVYAAAAPSRYRFPTPAAGGENIRYQQMIANSPDFLATRVSYLLDLRGEAVNIQTACSSSLVAIHFACQSLRLGQSDVALAGGVSIDPDQDRGYVYEEGMITSPDGSCLPFDAAARGTVPGNGAAVVVLQRLRDAVAQGRTVHAVIRATAVNNDGRPKSGFMAPSSRGQSDVIASALSMAGIPAESIGYLEAHGTATRLGDPIEIMGASAAFRMFTEARGFCSLGSLKANFGHLDRAAGVAGLIKAVCAVREGTIPPLLGFSIPNPDLQLGNTPFRCPTSIERWESDQPRRAGVSSFGIGGTNAHAIVEEFRCPSSDRTAEPDAGDRPVALPLSAHSDTALRALGKALSTHVTNHEDLIAVSHTLSVGRRTRKFRAVVVAPDAATAAGSLRRLSLVSRASTAIPPVAFLFAGQSAAMSYDAQRLVERFPVFHEEISAFAQAAGMSEEELLAGVSSHVSGFDRFAYQPSLAAVQVALARTAEHLGLAAGALCGSSIGEYAAAYLAGVFDRSQLMTALAARDELMRAAPEGRIMGVSCSPETAAALLLPGVELAGDNWSDRVLLSGPPDAVLQQQLQLEERGVDARILEGRIAFHSSLMAEAAADLRTTLKEMPLSRATRPIVSTLTGDWVHPGQLADPEHWVRHLRQPVRFRQAMETLMTSGHRTVVEASPGNVLSKLARRALAGDGQAVALGGESEGQPVISFLSALGELWSVGVAVDWEAANGTTGTRFVSLPPYPFERRRFWNHSPTVDTARMDDEPAPGHRLDASVWRPAPLAADDRRVLPRRVVVHGDAQLGETLALRLAERGTTVVRSTRRTDPGALREPHGNTDTVLIDLSLAEAPVDPVPEPGNPERLARWLDRGLLNPLVTLRNARPSRYLVVTRGLWPVVRDDTADTGSSAVVGLARCATHDWPGLRTEIVDLAAKQGDPFGEVASLLAELAANDERDVAYRRGIRYRRFYEPATAAGPSRLRDGGTYLVLGGTGRLGPVVAEAISREARATIVLTGRDPERQSTARQDRLVAAARERGCTILRRKLDSSSRTALRALLDELMAQHGRVDGVFHLAAHTARGDFDLLEELTLESALRTAQAKVCTAALLAEEMAGRDYDFVALFSSLSTVIGALRFGAYVSANAYLDAIAARMRAVDGQTWFSLVWDGWTEDGITRPGGLGSADGAALLCRALRAESPVVAPVAQPIERRVSQVRADLAAVAEADRAAVREVADTPMAIQVLDVITEITGYTEIDERRSFAALGIDSLQMMQIAARLRRMLGEAVSLGTLLAAQSVADIVALLVSAPRQVSQEHHSLNVAEASERELSTVQERLWFLYQLSPESDGYNVPFGWILPPETTLAAARAAVTSVLERHEVLRSAYEMAADGRPKRTTMPAERVPLEVAVLDPEAPEASFARTAQAFISRAFNLEQNSTRVLLTVDAGAIGLVFVCHHISVDAWSVRIIHDDLLSLLSGSTPEPADAPAAYRDFVRWEQDVREGPLFAQQTEFWSAVLRGIKPTVPPADDTPLGATGSVGAVAALVSPDSVDRLRRVVKAEGATFYTAGLTALVFALSQWCRTSDIVIGTNLANRSRLEFEGIVGMFVDPIVLRLAPCTNGSEATAGGALAHVKEHLGAALNHSDVPYADLVRLSGHSGDTTGNPLFSVISTMFDTEASDGGLQPLDVPLPTTSKFPLAVQFLPRRDGLLVHVLYAADRYLPATVERFLKQLVDFMEVLAWEGADAPLTHVDEADTTISARGRFANRLGQRRAAPPSATTGNRAG